MRFLQIIFGLALVAILGALLIWYLAYQVATPLTGKHEMSGIQYEVSVWTADGVPRIEARTESDAYVGLGFVHWTNHAWQMWLMRQAAAGRLAEQFGDRLLEVDSYMKSLGLVELAKDAYASLGPDDKSILQAYATGINEALQQEHTRLGRRFLRQQIEPESWEPWQALLMERLFLLISTGMNAQSDSTLIDTAELAQAEMDHTQLLTLLRLGGFEHSRAWAERSQEGLRLDAQYVYGSSQQRLMQPVVLTWESSRTLGASIPGWPVMLTGTNGVESWALMPATARTYRRFPEAAKPAFVRIASSSGRERLVGSTRLADAVIRVRDEMAVGPDSLGPLGVEWEGFRPGSDFSYWREILAGYVSPRRERLAGMRGIYVDAEERIHRVGGRGSVPVRRAAFWSFNEWSRFAEANLNQNQNEGVVPDRERSIWASQLTPLLYATMDTTGIEDVPLEREALGYLRNWDHRFSRSSIGASIFDGWMSNLSTRLGDLPNTPIQEWRRRVEADSLNRMGRLLRVGFRSTISGLETTFGDDPIRWRWESVQPQPTSEFTWADSLVREVDEPAAQAEGIGIAGHPSSVQWAPSQLLGPVAPTSVWSISFYDAAGVTIRVNDSNRGDVSHDYGEILFDDATRPSASSTLTLMPELR